MNYRILGEPIDETFPNYRGLYREEPMYVEGEDSVNTLWDWYATKAGDGGFIHDVGKAQDLIKAYERIGKHFELIRIDKVYSKKKNEEFLGIDISEIGGYSLLSFGLNFKKTITNKREISTLFLLIQKYFQPKLNKYFLFNNEKEAIFFLRVIEEIQIILPGMLENGSFHSYFVFRVKTI